MKKKYDDLISKQCFVDSVKLQASNCLIADYGIPLPNNFLLSIHNHVIICKMALNMRREYGLY